MPDDVDTACLQHLCDLAVSNETWLVDRVIAHADRAGLGDRGPRSKETWRDAVRGLTDALFQAVYAVTDGYAEGHSRNDPVVAYGVVRARTHSRRAVSPAMWDGMLECYRLAYLDLLGLDTFESSDAAICLRFVDRVFQRFENGFHTEWAALSHAGPTAARDGLRPVEEDAG